MHKRAFRIFAMPPMRRHERATLGYSYTSELGRGLFAGLTSDFALAIAVTVFGVRDEKLLLWLLSSAVFFGMLTAMAVTIVSSRWRKRNAVFALEVASRTFLIMAAVAAGRVGFVVLMTLAIMFSAINVPLISGIYGANFGKMIRGRAVGRLHGVAMLTSAVVAFVASEIVRGHPERYRWVFLGVGLASLLCTLAVRRIPEAARRSGGRPAISIRDILRIVRTDKAFLYLELCWFIFGFCNLWLVPLKVLRLDEMGYDIARITIATTVVMTGIQIVGLGLWGRIIYRMNFAHYRMLIGLFLASGFALFFFSTSYPLVLAGSAVWGLGLAGGVLSWRLVATFFTEPGMVPAYMAVHTLMAGIRGMIGPFLALVVRAHFGIQTAAGISIVGTAIATLMLVALVPMMDRRRRFADRGD